jgi:hypothetical protein
MQTGLLGLLDAQFVFHLLQLFFQRSHCSEPLLLRLLVACALRRQALSRVSLSA